MELVKQIEQEGRDVAGCDVEGEASEIGCQERPCKDCSIRRNDQKDAHSGDSDDRQDHVDQEGPSGLESAHECDRIGATQPAAVRPGHSAHQHLPRGRWFGHRA